MTGSQTTLTIGIPTFNRHDTVARRLDEILEFAPNDRVDLLVIDNGSSDGTYEKLTHRYARSGVRVLKNDTNLGYAGNLLRLIDEVESDYLLVVSDEDHLERAGVEALLRFCAEQRPHFVSPRAMVRGNDSYRGRTKTRPIQPEQFLSSSFYISGLTFDASVARAMAPAVLHRLKSNSAASVYPQVLLAALAIAKGKSFFLDELVSRQVEELETHIVERTGGEYYSVEGRWAQFRGFEEFFADEINHLQDEARRRLERMRNQYRGDVFSLLTSAAITEVPELSRYGSRSIARQSIDAIRGLLKRR